MFKKLNLAIYTTLLLGNFSTSHADPCMSDNSCQSLEALYMCAKETDSDLAKYLASDDVGFKKNEDGSFDYTVVQRFSDYATWYKDYEKYTVLHGQYAKLYDFEKLIKTAEEQGAPIDEKITNEFKAIQYRYYNNLVKSYPEDFSFSDLDKLESRAKSSKKHLFVPSPKAPFSGDSGHKKINQKVNIVNKSFRTAISKFLREQSNCLENFCQTNCSLAINPSADIIQSYRSALNLPMDMTDSEVVKQHVTTHSEACIDPHPAVGSRKMLLCSICKEGVLGKNDFMLPSCAGLSSKEIYKDE